MATPSIERSLTVEEYLRSSYRPDVDFVDGFLEDRNTGGFDHGRIQTALAAWFFGREREWNIRAVVEQRVQVSSGRFRIPDVCLSFRGSPIDQVVSKAPLVCIEILSADDSVYKMSDRVADYFRMWVEHIWIINPAAREAFICTPTGWNQPADGILTVPDTAINVPLAQIFASLDDA